MLSIILFFVVYGLKSRLLAAIDRMKGVNKQSADERQCLPLSIIICFTQHTFYCKEILKKNGEKYKHRYLQITPQNYESLALSLCAVYKSKVCILSEKRKKQPVCKCTNFLSRVVIKFFHSFLSQLFTSSVLDVCSTRQTRTIIEAYSVKEIK